MPAIATDLPALNVKQVPPRQPSTGPAPQSENAAPATKKSAGKGSTSRPTKELDANGQPVKKSRPKRVPKPVEEVVIYFRVKTLEEKHQEAVVESGFPPSAPASDNEAEGEQQTSQKGEDEDNPQEEKKEDNPEGDGEPRGEAKAPEEKIFDQFIKVLPKTKLKGIR